MRHARRESWLHRAITAAVCVGGIVLAGSVERASEQRGNRLHRAGAFPEAAGVYGGRVRADGTPDRLRYNFGTTLLDLGSAASRGELTRASESADVELRARAFYNLGLWHLARARDVTATDSVRAYAGWSVDASKGVLRLEPGRADARWNLALAQRMLDSMNADDGRAGTETVEGSADSDERILSDDLREFEDDSEVTDAPQQGADEALAESDETDPLSVIEAEQILATDRLDPSIMVRKLLAYEGRASRRLRVGRTGPRW